MPFTRHQLGVGALRLIAGSSLVRSSELVVRSSAEREICS
jgi:hypothetical protein